jgi:hypothetical protein
MRNMLELYTLECLRICTTRGTRRMLDHTVLLSQSQLLDRATVVDEYSMETICSVDSAREQNDAWIVVGKSQNKRKAERAKGAWTSVLYEFVNGLGKYMCNCFVRDSLKRSLVLANPKDLQGWSCSKPDSTVRLITSTLVLDGTVLLYQMQN